MRDHSIRFDNYYLHLGKSLTWKIDQDDEFFGLEIMHNGDKFLLTHNKRLNWSRIYINYADGSWKDLPFNEKTLHFLPEELTVTDIK